MTWTNYDDVVAQLRDGGLEIDGGIDVDTTRPVRCFEAGGDREKRGWYWLNEITIEGQRYIVGAFGVYHGNDNGKRKVVLRVDGKKPALTAEQNAAIAARQKANQARMKAMRAAEAERASQEASRVWRAYAEEGASDYLARKGVGAHGLRFSPAGGTLAVPMQDAGGKIWGLQLIRGKDRGNKLEKQYWPKGVATQGHWHLIGGIPKDLLLVAEGYATAATLFEATGLPVAIAFDAGNLLHVATAIKRAYRKARILVCADDDYRTEGNPGTAAAQAAAHAVDGAWVAPVFAAERPADKKGPTDFNDLQALEGQAIVRAQIETRLRELQWDLAHAAREPVAKGAGERAEIPSIVQIDEALDRYVFIYGGKGTLFDATEHMLVPKVDVVELLPKDGWNEMRTRKRVARIEEVGFDPGGVDARIRCNLWGGWPTVPRAGRCDALLELGEYLCSNEKNSTGIWKYILFWLAYPIQHPGAKMRTALVIHGPQGTGKNLFFEAVMAAYGVYGRIIDQSAIEDKFNDWASRKLFLIADEVVARQELFHTKNKLKGIITGEWIRINPKNVAAHDERNHVNLVFLSNESQPLVLEKDDRRYAVVWTPEKLSEQFYADVKAELNAGGAAALHHYLLHLDLGDFDEHTKPPMTEAKRDLIDRSLDSVQRFINDWQAGEVIHRHGEAALPFGPCSSTQLYRAYLEWCRRVGEPRPRPENQFAGEITKLPGWFKGHKDRRENFNTRDTIRQRFIIPSDAALAIAAREGAPTLAQEPNENLTEWLTRCFFAFSDAIGDPA